MAKYKIFVKRSAQKELVALPNVYLLSITKMIAALAVDARPPGAEKLSADEKYRLRKGPYRILYSIEDSELIIWIVKIGHRREVFR